MSFIDSRAAFEQRCNELCAPAGLYDLLIAQQVDTFSSLAYAIATPNRSPTDQEFDAFANQVFGTPSLGQMSLLRRIHFESCTFILRHLKSQVAGDTQDGIRKLPFAEKQARFEAVRTKLSGFIVQGETEPSFALIDKCQAMFDSGAVTWIPPSACTKRDLEIQAAPKDAAQVVRIEAQTLKVDTEAQKIGDADHGSEIKLQWCMQRKGIALEMCNLVSWSVSQEWIASLYNVYSTDPPPGFGRITLQQLIRADKELWTLMARAATSIKPDGTGKRPLDDIMTKLINDPRVTMHLLALPNRAASSSHASADPGDNKRQSQASHSNASKQAPKKKMRPGRNQRTKPAPPAELKDCYQTTTDGKPICWAYNLAQGCSLSTSGSPPSCSKVAMCVHSVAKWAIHSRFAKPLPETGAEADSQDVHEAHREFIEINMLNMQTMISMQRSFNRCQQIMTKFGILCRVLLACLKISWSSKFLLGQVTCQQQSDELECEALQLISRGLVPRAQSLC